MTCVFATATATAMVLAAATVSAADKPPAKSRVDFSRSIRPLLANKCLKCHGPGRKQQAGDLRLDLAKSAIGTAIVPG